MGDSLEIFLPGDELESVDYSPEWIAWCCIQRCRYHTCRP